MFRGQIGAPPGPFKPGQMAVQGDAWALLRRFPGLCHPGLARALKPA